MSRRRSWPRSVAGGPPALGIAAFALVLAGTTGAQEPAPGLPPAAERAQPLVPRLAGPEAVEVRLRGWVEEHPGRVRLLALPRSRGGLPAAAVELGAPGSEPIEERPTLFFVGGLDGRTLAGVEACLALGESLLMTDFALPPDLCVVLVPAASPDGLAATLAGRTSDGRNALPLDEDGDGLVDEDGPDDVDGDGERLSMLVEDRLGTWRRADDARFLVPAVSGDWPRYRLLREGEDDDGDGALNEDGPGGVQLDRNFPIGWTGEESSAGSLPLAEPLARGLADLVLSRRAVAVVLFQGVHGELLVPAREEGPLAAAARPAVEWVRRTLGEAVGREVRALSPGALDDTLPRGTAIDWLAASTGALALEVSPWRPRIGGADGPPRSAFDPAWAEWLDNGRGGIGFEDWHPVTLDGGGRALVGGWRAGLPFTPSAEELPELVAGLTRFATELIAGRPRLQFDYSAERVDGLCKLALVVHNLGALPSGIAPGSGCRLRLELPPGSELLAGREGDELGHLAGGAPSGLCRWLVAAPEGAVLRVRARDDWTAEASLEVRP